MAGCTDPEYSDSSCPHKDNSGQQLLGLVQCSDSQADGTALWSACPGPTTKTALGAPSQCSCSGTAAGLLWMTTSLSALATLPTAVEETIQFNDGHYPTVKTSGSRPSTFASTKASTTTTRSSSSVTSAPTTSPASANSTAGGLSTSAEIGIGIGATLLGLCATGLAIFAVLVYRRRSSSAKGKDSSLVHVTENNNMGLDVHENSSPIIHHPFSPGSTFGGNNSNSLMPDSDTYAYTGYKSELPADPQFSSQPSELPADEILPAPTRARTPYTTTQPHSRQITDLVSPLSPGMGWRSPRTVSETSSLQLSTSPLPSSFPRSTQAAGRHENAGSRGRTDAGADPPLGSISELGG